MVKNRKNLRKLNLGNKTKKNIKKIKKMYTNYNQKNIALLLQEIVYAEILKKLLIKNSKII